MPENIRAQADRCVGVTGIVMVSVFGSNLKNIPPAYIFDAAQFFRMAGSIGWKSYITARASLGDRRLVALGALLQSPPPHSRNFPSPGQDLVGENKNPYPHRLGDPE